MNDTLLATVANDRTDCWTRREILQQPHTLRATQQVIDNEGKALDAFLTPLLERTGLRIVLTGAGTSAFIGDSIAPLISRTLGCCVNAVATTDIVSAPNLHLRRDEPLLLVSFGRSGNSPESIAAVDLVDALVDDAFHLVITCNPDGALAARAGERTHVVLLPEATHDRGFAMTSSYTAMMLAAVSILAGRDGFGPRVDALSAAVERVATTQEERMAALAARGFRRIVYLGSGLFAGLSREAALKMLELTDGQIATQFDTPLGFRHGPKTFVDGETLVVTFVSNNPLTRRYDLDIVAELRADNKAAALLVISARMEDEPDLLVRDMAEAQDVDLLFPYAVPAQLLALHSSLALGVTPDTPNASGVVNRVVQGVRIHAYPQ